MAIEWMEKSHRLTSHMYTEKKKRCRIYFETVFTQKLLVNFLQIFTKKRQVTRDMKCEVERSSLKYYFIVNDYLL